MASIKELQHEIHEWAKSKGWWDSDRPVAELLCLLHSEVSEALEDYRDGYMELYMDGDKPCGFPSEMADIAIRLLDTCEAFGIDLEEQIARKMKYNRTRPYRHGGKKA